MNSIKYLLARFSDFAYNNRRNAKKRADALLGKTTSGHLTPGERDRFFRDRRK